MAGGSMLILVSLGVLLWLHWSVGIGLPFQLATAVVVASMGVSVLLPSTTEER